MCETTTVRVKHQDGNIDVVRMSHSQICALIGGILTPPGFWLGNCSATNSLGQNIKIVIESRLKK